MNAFAFSCVRGYGFEKPKLAQPPPFWWCCYSWYATTKACCVAGGSTSCWAVYWLQCSHYGLLSSSVHVLKPASQIAPGVRERRAFAAWNWHSQCPHIAEVTKKSSGERKTVQYFCCAALLKVAWWLKHVWLNWISGKGFRRFRAGDEMRPEWAFMSDSSVDQQLTTKEILHLAISSFDCFCITFCFK